MHCIVSLDGLSESDIEILSRLLPRSHRFLAAMQRCVVRSPLPAAQSAWGELLSGVPWFRNGCAGYSRPMRSLNRMAVFEERHLREPVLLLAHKPGRPAVAINLPLVFARAPGSHLVVRWLFADK